MNRAEIMVQSKIMAQKSTGKDQWGRPVHNKIMERFSMEYQVKNRNTNFSTLQIYQPLHSPMGGSVTP